MDRQTIQLENKQERERLAALIAKLNTDQLNHPMEAGWTVSAVLAHLQFWDLRAITLIRKWKLEGIGASPIDTDIVNEATRVLCLEIPPAAIGPLMLVTATELDTEIENLTAEMFEGIQEKGTTVHLPRFVHRRTHREEIEKVLGAG